MKGHTKHAQAGGQANSLKTGGHAEQQPCPKHWLAKQNVESPKTRHSLAHLPKIHDKPFGFYPVNTERKGGVGGRGVRQRHYLPKSHQYC